jgi:SAM-dependent methyltransferase
MPDRDGPHRLIEQVKQSAPYGALKEWTKALKRRAGLGAWRGDRYRCPICHTGLRAFKPVWRSFWVYWQQYESIHSPLAMETFNVGAFSCPACNAFDRERLTALYLERAFRGFDPQRRYRLIEFAPAHALQRMIRPYRFIEYRSADLLSKRVNDRVDLTDCPYPDGSVDIFLCSHVLEHIENDRQAMRELNRILTPDGFGIVLVPLFPGIDETHEDPGITTIGDRAKYFAAGDHVRQYGKRDFIERLTQAGFHVEQCGIDYFGEDVFKRAGIAPNSVLYVVHKGAAQPS